MGASAMTCSTTMAFQYVTQLMALNRTTGSACWNVRTQRMTFDSYPIARSLNWMHNDDVSTAERVTFYLRMADAFQDVVHLVETFTVVLDAHRQFADSVAALDDFYRQVDYARLFGDAVSVSDTFTLHFAPGAFADLITVPDAVALHVWKRFADSVVVSDAFSNGKNENLNDTIGADDHGTIYAQGYFDTNGYFLTDYFGYSYSW